MSKTDAVLISRVIQTAIDEAGYFEEQLGACDSDHELSDTMIEAIEDCYTTAAVAQKMSEWLALNPGKIEGNALLIVSLCTEVAAAVRKEMRAGIHATHISRTGERVCH
jgi:hypothetical protein